MQDAHAIHQAHAYVVSHNLHHLARLNACIADKATPQHATV